MPSYVGIDPGVSGGIAWLREALPPACWKMPETPGDLLELFRQLSGDGSFAMVERINAGVFGQKKQGRMGVVSAFTFGKGIGYIEMALIAAGIPFDFVSPVSWQNAMACRSRGDKNVTKRRAQQLFPSIKVTHATADALLIAEYCKRRDQSSLLSAMAATQSGVDGPSGATVTVKEFR